jgi:GDP-L-fucose synthase
MRILVTGASGFLGRHLLPRLVRDGHIVVAPGSRELDLTRDGGLAALDGERFDMIFHLAAWTRAGTFCRTHGGDQWVVNQRLNTNALAWWRDKQPQAKLIALGTSVSYPKGVPLREEHYLDGAPIDDFYAYAMTKRMLLVGLQTLAKQYGLKYGYFVPSTLKILRGKELGDPVVLWGDGHQKRELVFIDDFVELFLRLSLTAENEVVNIGEGGEHSIREFAAIICDAVGFDFARIEFDTSKYVGLKSKVLDVERMRQLAPEFRPTAMQTGLRRTIDWMQAEKAHLVLPAS